ncbi:signal peptide peptidase SppA [Fundidesulfovibrio soli]|uniref:signal peptide peptidase SppA n=1 Tax=Fundidesulfovibrio soli TaxID=2922716 RepID=UPI001FAFEC1D|nr:signal peptide peptidase SppA [Fundidesulfovibrio soli]
MALFSSYSQNDEGEGGSLFSSHSEKLGVATLEGTIDDSARMVRFLRKLREDSAVRGVLLRVNSGGGAYGPSQELYYAVKKLAEKKPVVVSIGSVAASGGYYAACPAKVIYALPGSITGSIGVLSRFPNLQGVSEKLGFTYNSFTSGKLKDAGSPFRPLTEEDRAYLQGLIGDLHDIFVGDVAQARKLTPEALNALQGKAVTGTAGLSLGLVDKLGTQEDAFEELKKLSSITAKQPAVIRGPKKEQSRLEEFFGRLGAAFFKKFDTAMPDLELRAQ